MVLFVIPKRITEMREDIERDIKREIIKVAMQYGVTWELIDDSKVINEDIDEITSKIIRLHETIRTCGTNTRMTNIDKVWFKPVKNCKADGSAIDNIKRLKKFSKDMDKIELEEKLEEIKKKKGGKKNVRKTKRIRNVKK